eukprot:gb/GFBE01024666.1/.p1 GENE.gb/GFBE01024666.1/~~gb/GFBE01024666.1/.p1  ORF type:complete len:929 (+),score=228.51 gb/GFBE01024666.1/:1-2787(+)
MPESTLRRCPSLPLEPLSPQSLSPGAQSLMQTSPVGSMGCRRRCEGRGCSPERYSSKDAGCELREQPSKTMSISGTSFMSATARSRLGSSWSKSSGTLSRKASSPTMKRIARQRLPKLDRNCSSMSFEDIFKLSYSRAAKRMASERHAPGSKLLSGTKGASYFKSLLEKRQFKSTPLNAAEAVCEDESWRDMGPSDDDESPSSKQEPAPGAAKKGKRAMDLETASIASSEVLKEDFELEEILKPPDKAETLARLNSNPSDISDREIEHMRKAFMEHQFEGSEVHQDDLTLVLDFLGYLKISDEAIEEMVAKTTKYSTLSFEEFLRFMALAREYESSQVHKSFETFDDDGSGELSADELEGLLKSLGITPFRSTIAGALAVVDEDGSGSLDFEEFVQLLGIYRKTEGFARQEVVKLFRVFGRFADPLMDGSGRRQLKPDKMIDALVDMFGNQASALAEKLGSQLMTKRTKKGAQDGKPKRPADDHEGMVFREFLVWARRLREAEVDLYKQEFNKADEDGGGCLDPEEIRQVLIQLGYTPLRSVVFDLIDTFDTDKGGTLDFDEFVNMMELFRRTDGFTRQEISEFNEIFKMYDTQNLGEVDVVQVGAMLRSLGFNTDYQRAEAMVKKVDWNGSNSLDFSEFVRLMRLHREEELSGVKDAFADFARQDDEETMDPKQMKHALARLGYPESISKPIIGLFSGLCGNSVDFDGLVGVSDGCRRRVMVKMRKQAGFPDEDVAKFAKTFRALDDDNSGEIAQLELVQFCKHRGLPLQTKEDQKQLLKLIDDARANARSSGVSDEDCGPEGSRAVPFWVFVHLQRILQTWEDQRKNEEFKKRGGHNFSDNEVNELKTAFGISLQQDEHGAHQDKLSLEGLWGLLSRLGVELNPMDKEQVKAKLFMQSGQTGAITFEAFLRLIAWVVTANFGGGTS